jgi:murein DD-endopeptidase MepM/ murein hydrolase activator NlpD
MAGYQYEGLFMEAGFSYGYAHMNSLSVKAGEKGVIANQLLGLSGDTGTMVVPLGADHLHFGISNDNYGSNRYLSDVLGLDDSTSFNNGNWKWKDTNKRFYNPLTVYERWIRR